MYVTGAGGFTGRFLIDRVRREDDHRIVGLDLTEPEQHQADEFVELDLCSEQTVSDVVKQFPPDIVFHLAGLMPPSDEQSMRDANVKASVAIVQALANSPKRRTRLLSIGSAAEYLPHSEPLSENAPTGGVSAYGRTKSEQTAKLLGSQSSALSITVARPFNLLGPGLSENLVAAGLCRQFLTTGIDEGYVAPKGPIESVRDFVDVRDAVEAYWLLAHNGRSGQVYNVCSGAGTEIHTIIRELEKLFKCSVRIRRDYDSSKIKPDIVIGDNRKLVQLGWRRKYSLQQSLKSMVDSIHKIPTG